MEEDELCKCVCASESLACALVDISSLQILPFGPAGMNLTVELLGLTPSDVPLP